MNTLKAFRNHGFNPQKRSAFCRPIAAGAGTILFAAKDDQWGALLLIGHCRVKDRHLASVWTECVAALDPIEHLILDADIGEGAAHHHLVIAATRAIGVELSRADLALGEIFTSWGCVFERAGGRDMIRGDHITQNCHNLGVLKIGDLVSFHRNALEIGWILHIGRGGGPIVGFLIGHIHGLPFLIALKHIGIFRQEGLTGHRRFHHFGNLLRGGPDVFEVDVIAVAVLANHICGQVNVQSASQSIGHHQGWRGQIIGADIWGDAPFKVSVAGQHRSGDEIAL